MEASGMVSGITSNPYSSFSPVHLSLLRHDICSVLISPNRGQTTFLLYIDK